MGICEALCQADPSVLKPMIEAALKNWERQLRVDLHRIAERNVIKPGVFRKGVTLESRLAQIEKLSERRNFFAPNLTELDRKVIGRMNRSRAWWDRVRDIESSIDAGATDFAMDVELYAFIYQWSTHEIV